MRLIHFYSTHFKPPSSVCNFLLRSHVEFGRLLLLKYAIYSLLYRCTNYHFRCTHSSQENHIQTIFYRNHVFIILYNLQLLLSCLFLLCKSCNTYALSLAETHFVCVTTASLFLSCQVYIPGIIHISKRIYFLAAVHYKICPKDHNPRLCYFSCDCIFKIAACCAAALATLGCRAAVTSSLTTAFCAVMTTRSWCQTL